MLKSVVDDFACPVDSGRVRCAGVLRFGETLPIVASEGGSEVREAILECESCDAKFPVIAGVPILVSGAQEYVRLNATEIMSSVGPDSISSELWHYLMDESQRLPSSTQGYGNWHNVSMYLEAHYGKISSVVSDYSYVKEFLNCYDSSDFYVIVQSLIAESAEGRKLGRALDVGCGVGGMTSRLTRHCDFSYGVDLSFRSILVARMALRHQPYPLDSYWSYGAKNRPERHTLETGIVPNVEFLVASGFETPFREHFDLVTCLNALDVTSDPGSLLDSVTQMCRPGGMIVASSGFGVPGSPSADLFDQEEEYLRVGLEKVGRIVAERLGVPWLLGQSGQSFLVWLLQVLVAIKRS